MNFRENLHFLMECRGIQIKELSANTGISENTIKTYLKADSAEPKVSKAVAIARALGTTAEFLLDGNEIPAEAALLPERIQLEQLLPALSQKNLQVVLTVARALQAQ